VEDVEVLRAFVDEGAKRAFGPSLHIEGDVLFYDGWWQASVRVSPRVFAVRYEDPPEDTTMLEKLAETLAARSLADVGTDYPLVGVITYSEIALGPVGWSVWAPDADTAQADLHERVGRDAFFGDEVSPNPVEPDYSAELGGARRLSGLPPSLVLALGVEADRTAALAEVLTECRFESRALEDVTPDICGSLLPTLMLVDATAQAGRELIMEMRAAACGRFIPVVAVGGEGGVPLGADVAVDPAAAPTSWAEPIRRLLP
jgi:hypothetical protein